MKNKTNKVINKTYKNKIKVSLSIKITKNQIRT